MSLLKFKILFFYKNDSAIFSLTYYNLRLLPMLILDKYTSKCKTFLNRFIPEVHHRFSNSFIQHVQEILKGIFTKPSMAFGIAPYAISFSSKKMERLMSEETELTILRKLEEFETQLGFTNPNLSLASLAGELKTNTKYLSYVINIHKNKDFSNYINDLRVYYFINLIEETPVNLNYKISYLSNECGFSSHSRFATVFKNTTGVTPSAFLNQLKAKNLEE